MSRLSYTGFWRDFNPDTLPLTKIIREVCDIEVTNIKHADYVLYSVFSEKHWFVPDRCIKIFYTGENVTPDFNACDYAIGFDWMEYGDRYFRLPLYYLYANINEQMEEKHLHLTQNTKESKKDFCSITISNDNRNPIFKALFEKLSAYKQVHSGGKWNNNTGGRVNDKYAFDLTHKFSIACENSAHPGYTTEKLVQAFAANCIPIYWGDPTITRVFNPHAFINVADFDSVDDVVKRVKEIDANDELYYKMLQEPALINAQYSKEKQLSQLKQYISHIFNQPIENAYRRNRFFYGEKYIKMRQSQVKSASTVFHRAFWEDAARNIYYKIKK